MKISTKYINKFLEMPMSSIDISEIIEQYGIEVDKISKFGFIDNNIKIAIVEKVENIKNSNKLKKATIFDGVNKHIVLCGAPNCREGVFTAYAGIGSKIFIDEKISITISKRKILNIESYGMLCSEHELGIGSQSNEIIEFPIQNSDLLGCPLSHFTKDTIIDISITPDMNRCSSCYGIAQIIDLMSNRNAIGQNMISMSSEGFVDKFLFTSYSTCENIEYKDEPSFGYIKEKETPTTNIDFFKSVYSYSIGISNSPNAIVSSIFGSNFIKSKNRITVTNHVNPDDEQIAKKTKRALQNSEIISHAMDLYGALDGFVVTEKNLKKDHFYYQEIDIDRFEKVFEDVLTRNQIINIIDSVFTVHSNNTIAIPQEYNEYNDKEHLLSLISRIIGINSIPSNPIHAINNICKTSEVQNKIKEINKILLSSGYSQLITNSIVQKNIHNICKPSLSLHEPVSLIGKDMVMRTSIIESICESLNANHIFINKENKEILLFEIGQIFHQKQDRAYESKSMCIVGIPKEGTNSDFIFKIKGTVEHILKKSNIDYRVSPREEKIFQKYLSGEFKSNLETIGIFGKLDSDICRSLSISKPIYFAEISINSSKLNKDILITDLDDVKSFDITIKSKDYENFSDVSSILRKEAIKNSIEIYKKIDNVGIFDHEDGMKRHTLRVYGNNITNENIDLLESILNNREL